MKRLFTTILVLGSLLTALPAVAQYGGGGFGGGLGGGGNDAPAAAPPGSTGNPPAKMPPQKYFDGSVSDITGNVVTVKSTVAIPGGDPQVVTKQFELRDTTQYEPSGWKLTSASNVRVLYELKDGKLVVTKVIHGKD